VNITSINACAEVGRPIMRGKAADRAHQDRGPRAGPKGITVNAVAPGMVLTRWRRAAGAGSPDGARRGGARRLTEPEDIANAVLFFLSDAARNITGQVLQVDAGQYSSARGSRVPRLGSDERRPAPPGGANRKWRGGATTPGERPPAAPFVRPASGGGGGPEAAPIAPASTDRESASRVIAGPLSVPADARARL